MQSPESAVPWLCSYSLASGAALQDLSVVFRIAALTIAGLKLSLQI